MDKDTLKKYDLFISTGSGKAFTVRPIKNRKEMQSWTIDKISDDWDSKNCNC